MSSPQICVAAAGLVTSVGLDTSSTCSALRCRLNNFNEMGALDYANEPVVGARVPLLIGPVPDIERLAAMAVAAIRQALEGRCGIVLAEVPILLCVAEVGRVGRIPDLDVRLVGELERRFNHPFHPDSETIAEGQNSVSWALIRARKMLHAGGHVAILVVAADSLITGATVQAHLKEGRIMSTGVRAGYIPGEAAGALLLQHPDDTAATELRVYGVGTAREDATRNADLPFRAAGLTAAVKAALKDADAVAEEIDICLSDASGEEYYFEELALVQQRSGLEVTLWLPAECVGETGSAIGCIQIAWMFEAGRKIYLPGNSALLLASGEEGVRTAAILSFYHS
ncbi:hypothetical protein [Massilia genomosp. 1]|uniref:3-oxoacyl-ACP synthase n=1 Tax=Massilia genomosp. 1 TaxID=2609280 RepID=A0ABX0MV95_9BURK|nr:hypothetical protein [Massilia genomosp. 1]NHZ66677.1 hypothetical protein [Massilia genomosp. 1]